MLHSQHSCCETFREHQGVVRDTAGSSSQCVCSVLSRANMHLVLLGYSHDWRFNTLMRNTTFQKVLLMFKEHTLIYTHAYYSNIKWISVCSTGFWTLFHLGFVGRCFSGLSQTLRLQTLGQCCVTAAMLEISPQ